MTSGWRCWEFGLVSCLAISGAVASFENRAYAQIIPDSTLGSESSVVTPTNIDGVPTERIDGGATRGANLFHSFEQFSVPTGGAAHFNNALDVQNIISRVTGGSVSNIDGLLRANASANLFLLNPNGIIFGPNAELNIGGSFVGSTASSLNFADGSQFSASDPQTTLVLTVSVPQNLQFGGTVGGIHVQEADLQVQPGSTLALVGGDVALEGGSVIAQEGRIELGSVGSPSLVSLTPTEQGWVLGYEGVQNFQDIKLSQGAVVKATGSDGADIQVQGRRITLTDRSRIYVDNQSPNDGGDISIQAKELILRQGSAVSTTTDGAGQGGNLELSASDSVKLIGTSAEDGVPSSLYTQTLGSGAGGNLKITTGQLIVSDGAIVSTATLGSGQAGTLEVNADAVKIRDPLADDQSASGLVGETQETGAGGNVILTTGPLIVSDGAMAPVDAQTGSGFGSVPVPESSCELGLLVLAALAAFGVAKVPQRQSSKRS